MNTLLATIRKLNKEFTLQLDVMATEFSSGCSTVFNILTGDDRDFGQRIAFWFCNNGRIYFSTAVQWKWEIKYYPSGSSPVNQWIHIKVSQTKTGDDYVYKLEVNGKEVQKKKNTNAQTFENLKVYVSDPWYEAQKGYIRNLSIKGNVIPIIFRALCSILFTYILTFMESVL